MHETILSAICRQFPKVSMNRFRGEIRFVVPSERLHIFLEELKTRHGFDMLVDITCVDYLGYPTDGREETLCPKDRFGLVYVLADTGSERRVVVRTFLGEERPRIPTVFDLWRAADWLEREVWDLFGIRFEGHPDLRRIVLPEEFESHPLRKDYPLQGLGERHNLPVIPRNEDRVEKKEEKPEKKKETSTPEEDENSSPFSCEPAGDGSDRYIWTMNFGPQHPATHTTLRLVLKLEGERVVDAVPHIGYLHSGFEKLGESLDYNQYVTVTDRMNYVSPMSNNVAWHEAVERLLGLEIPRRARYIRVIIAELSRISDHLLCIGAMGLDTGGFTSFLYAFNPRETINDIFEAICGARFTNSYTRVGGLMYDLKPKAIEMIRTFLAKELPRAVRDFEKLLTRNRIFVDRTRGIGVLTRAEAIELGCTGPVARAAGVPCDVRKDDPYLVYDELDFDVCCATEGDCYARYLVRLEEIRQSMKLVEQAMENLPEGPVRVGPDRRVISPETEKVHATIEGLITHFELTMSNRGFATPCEELYTPTEAPNGELGFYIAGDGTDTAYRARCRPPSLIHFSTFPYLIRGHRLSDVVAILGSLNIIAAELDR